MAKKKKWKKRLKKLAKAAIIGGALYGGAKLLKNRRNALIDKGIEAANADKGSDMLSSAKDYITKKADVVAPIQSTFVGGGIHQGKTPKGDIVKRMRNNMINTAEGSPLIDNPYRAPVNPGAGRPSWRKGGRVTGAAKRGFGRALMKGKK